MSKAVFLRSSHTSPLFTGSRSQQASSVKFLKKYDNGYLKPMNLMRIGHRKYTVIEDKLVRENACSG
eukprot:10480130-Ditylum_brightwellii.AAC.1